MIVRTCLLISDDPDDHAEFSEALYEISDDIILMTVSDVKKAIDLLLYKKCFPEYVFFNVGMSDFTPDEFVSAIHADTSLANISVIAYGENIQPLSTGTSRITRFLTDGLSFSEFKRELKKVLAN